MRTPAKGGQNRRLHALARGLSRPAVRASHFRLSSDGSRGVLPPLVQITVTGPCWTTRIREKNVGPCSSSRPRGRRLGRCAGLAINYGPRSIAFLAAPRSMS